MRHVEKGTQIVVLKTAQLELVQECELPPLLEHFPDMIEVGKRPDIVHQYFRIGITDRKAFYREGVSYRISS